MNIPNKNVKVWFDDRQLAMDFLMELDRAGISWIDGDRARALIPSLECRDFDGIAFFLRKPRMTMDILAMSRSKDIFEMGDDIYETLTPQDFFDVSATSVLKEVWE